jgi:acetyl esterase/lipase
MLAFRYIEVRVIRQGAMIFFRNKRNNEMRATLLPLILFITMQTGFGQLSPSATWAAHATNEYQVIPNVTYLTASNYEAKMDIYQRRGATTPQPTVIFMHGGFWAAGAKETSLMSLMPWFEMGWNVVNVEYRLARVALAPAAVEDCLCALRFVGAQAKTYNIDLNRLVTSGESAGGHLSLTTAMIPESAGLDRQCAGAALPKVAAVINWYGITDVADVVDGPHRANLAAQWLGSLPNRDEITHRVSPLTYVRAGLPPIMTVHGDSDPLVPYPQAVKLHDALTKAGVQNQLLTIPGGKHGGFTPEERTRIYIAVREFLAKNGLADGGK